MEPIIAYFDGLCEPRNPGGYACGGYVIPPNQRVPAQRGGKCFCSGPEATNNVAEYEAALLALRVIHATGYRGPVNLRGDSQLVVRHYSGEYACRAPNLQGFLRKLHRAGEIFADLTLTWVPREENEEADAESAAAYWRATGRQRPERRRG